MLVQDVHKSDPRMGKMTLLAEGWTVLGTSSQGVPEGVFLAVSDRKVSLPGAIPYGFSSQDSFEQKGLFKVLSRLLTVDLPDGRKRSVKERLTTLRLPRLLAHGWEHS